MNSNTSQNTSELMSADKKDFSSDYNWSVNGIGFLRLLLASLVILGHGPVLGGYEGYGVTLLGPAYGYGTVAVMGFFTMSGILITRSWESSNGLKDFFVKRVLRIFPGYWVCLIACAFLFGPLAWILSSRPVSLYPFTGQESALDYVINNFTSKMNQDFIRGLYFTVDGNPQGVNYPLWTIISEFTCYVFTGILGALSIGKKHRSIFLAVTILLLGYLFVKHNGATESTGIVGRLPHVLSYLIGVCAYYFHEKIPLRPSIGYASLVIGCVLSFNTYTSCLFPVFFAYSVIVMGFCGRVKNIERKADLSYGIYMYGWPVQIILGSVLSKSFGLYGYLLVSLLIVIPIAALSWYGVEKPAIKLKKFFIKKALPNA